MKEFIINENEAGQRFDKYLAKLLREAPKSFFYKMMRKKNITLNGKKATGNEKLFSGDHVKLFLSDETFEKFSGNDSAPRAHYALDIIYEDETILLINKPAGMLSVPGKEDAVSVYSLMREQYPEADGPLTVHRLDMATSGLMLIAKTKRVHQNLQAQFKNRLVRKRYVALLEGIVPKDKGTVDLPLCLNPLDRPRQMVHTEHGKPAITDYQVLERLDGKRTRIAFYPRTGRTHQLRIHAAHPLGLHCPIIGDELYGEKADRLYLHAEYLEFTHPITGETVRITKEAEF